MIVTDLTNILHQSPLTPPLRQAIEFLRRKDLGSLPDGTTAIDGTNVYAIMQGYGTETAREPRFEYHRKYIDVQYMLFGEEIIGWAPVEEMIEAGSYDADKDVCFGTVRTGRWTPVRLKAGQLAILWPEDAHAPRLAADAPSPVRKIVVKVAV